MKKKKFKSIRRLYAFTMIYIHQEFISSFNDMVVTRATRWSMVKKKKKSTLT